jgi:hypothetical protein
MAGLGSAEMSGDTEFQDTGNGWAALGFLVTLILGVVFIVIQPLHFLGWLFGIAGAVGGWRFLPRDAATNRRRAEAAAKRRSEAGRLTLWQFVSKAASLIRQRRAASRVRNGDFGALFEGVHAAGQARELDALRYWNPLPTRVRMRFTVDPEKAKLGPASLKRRAQNDFIHVGLDSTAIRAVPIIHVATAMMGTIGRLDDHWATKLAPFFEVGGSVRATIVDAGIEDAPGGYTTWAMVELSPSAANC